MLDRIKSGVDYIARGQYSHAVNLLEDTLKLIASRYATSDLNQILGWIGLAYLSSGEKGKGEAIAKATEQEPLTGELGLRLFRARWFSDEGQESLALGLYREALTSETLSTWENAAVLLEKSRLEDALGNYGQARSDLDRAEQLAGLLGDKGLLSWCKRLSQHGHSPGTLSANDGAGPFFGVPKLRFHLLGEFQVFRGDEPLSLERWKRLKSVNLLQYMAVQPHWRVPRDKLLELFWPGSMSINALYVTLHDLRKGLCQGLSGDVDYVKMTKGFVGLEPSLILGSDFREFRTCVQAARLHWQDDKANSLSCYREARRLYDGEFLSATNNGTWVEPVRENLRQMYLETLIRLAPYEEEPLTTWLEVLELEPTHEKAVVNAMILLAKLGRKDVAVAQYRRYYRYLRDELGLDPSHDVQTVFRSILENKIPNREVENHDQ